MPFPYVFPFYFSGSEPSRTFTVWCDSVDVTASTLLGTSFSNSLGGVGTLNIKFESTVTVGLSSVVKIDDINLDTVIFWGKVREWTCKQVTHNRYVKECIVYDHTKVIYDATGITATYNGTEKEVLIEAFAANCPTVNVGAGVITGNASSMVLTDGSLRDGLDALRAAGSRIWYVDDYAELQWFTLGNWPEAPFDVSDTPDNITTFPFHSFEYTEDSINPAAAASRGSLKIFRSGLHAGQHLEITNSVVDGSGGFGNSHYPITGVSGRLITTANDDIQWEYTIEFGFWDSLLAGYRSNNKFTSRVTSVPIPTQAYQVANKKYVLDNAGIGTASDTVTDETTWGVTPQEGISSAYSRADHTHGTQGMLFATQNIVTGSRALDAVYRNENTFPIMVVAVVKVGKVSWEDGLTADGFSQVYAYCSSDNTPSDAVDRAEITVDAIGAEPSDEEDLYLNLVFIVPADYYYELVSDFASRGKNPVKESWIEYGGTGTAI
jgi:hypothetical protein